MSHHLISIRLYFILTILITEDGSQPYICLIIATQLVFFPITYNNTVLESVRLKSLIDVLICKLHYGFGGIRQLMLSRKVSFSLFLLNSNNPYVQKLDRMRMIDWCKDCIFVFLMY